jgi:acyl-CoA thioester hydrolase
MTYELYSFHTDVKAEWVDHNSHMNDAAYNRVFSDATDSWLAFLGLDKEAIEQLCYTVFTLENHVLFLKEMKLHEPVTVKVALIDHDAKRLHAFMTMLNEDNVKCATYEVMLMGIDTKNQRPSPFPEKIKSAINDYESKADKHETPLEIGHKIEIIKK